MSSKSFERFNWAGLTPTNQMIRKRLLLDMNLLHLHILCRTTDSSNMPHSKVKGEEPLSEIDRAERKFGSFSLVKQSARLQSKEITQAIA